jgi:hypothetical protein
MAIYRNKRPPSCGKRGYVNQTIPVCDMAQITLATRTGDAWVPFCDTRWPAKTAYRLPPTAAICF